MRETYRTVFGPGSGLYEEKRSKFLSVVFPVSSEEEAASCVESVRKKEYGANHHCYAYVIGVRQEIRKCSDDGEPQKTAGLPMLNVLLSEGLTNVIVIVSRYFGGTLLGTGGLVRAYESAAKAGVSDAGVVERIPGVVCSIGTDYAGYEKLRRFLFDRKIAVVDTVFSDVVTVKTVVKEEEIDRFIAAVTDLLQGRADLKKDKEVRFSVLNGATELYEG